MLNIAFICVHNSCRSQMAEAIAKKLNPDEFNWYSAGTELKNAVNSQAVKVVRQMYGIDMCDHRPKLISDIPPVDVVVTMGCNVSCPSLPCKHREDWGLADPTGSGDEVFVQIATAIEHKIVDFVKRLRTETADCTLRQ